MACGFCGVCEGGGPAGFMLSAEAGVGQLRKGFGGVEGPSGGGRTRGLWGERAGFVGGVGWGSRCYLLGWAHITTDR